MHKFKYINLTNIYCSVIIDIYKMNVKKSARLLIFESKFM